MEPKGSSFFEKDGLKPSCTKIWRRSFRMGRRICDESGQKISDRCRIRRNDRKDQSKFIKTQKERETVLCGVKWQPLFFVLGE